MFMNANTMIMANQEITGALSYPRTGKRGVPQQFPRRLYTMLQSESNCTTDDDATTTSNATNNNPLIQWSESGQAFRIIDIEEFSTHVLPKYFRTSKFSSFQRNLNLYGFSKVRRGPDTDMYAHPSFLRGHPELLSQLKKCKHGAAATADKKQRGSNNNNNNHNNNNNSNNKSATTIAALRGGERRASPPSTSTSMTMAMTMQSPFDADANANALSAPRLGESSSVNSSNVLLKGGSDQQVAAFASVSASVTLLNDSDVEALNNSRVVSPCHSTTYYGRSSSSSIESLVSAPAPQPQSHRMNAHSNCNHTFDVCGKKGKERQEQVQTIDLQSYERNFSNIHNGTTTLTFNNNNNNNNNNNKRRVENLDACRDYRNQGKLGLLALAMECLADN